MYRTREQCFDMDVNKVHSFVLGKLGCGAEGVDYTFRYDGGYVIIHSSIPLSDNSEQIDPPNEGFAVLQMRISPQIRTRETGSYRPVTEPKDIEEIVRVKLLGCGVESATICATREQDVIITRNGSTFVMPAWSVTVAGVIVRANDAQKLLTKGFPGRGRAYGFNLVEIK